MRRSQIICLWVTVGVVVLMCLFPPWLYRPSGALLGYHPLWWDTRRIIYPSEPPRLAPACIATRRLLLQCAAVGLLGGAAFLTISYRR